MGLLPWGTRAGACLSPVVVNVPRRCLMNIAREGGRRNGWWMSERPGGRQGEKEEEGREGKREGRKQEIKEEGKKTGSGNWFQPQLRLPVPVRSWHSPSL